MTIDDILFHAFAFVAVISALLVIFNKNPVYSALFLALCMSVLGAMFFTLNAYFVAVAQITVYAGAVMVLFVMVVMLFDLKRESEEILKFSPVTTAKVLAAALLCGFLVGTSWLGVTAVKDHLAGQVAPGTLSADLEKPIDGKIPKSIISLSAEDSDESTIKATPEEARELLNKMGGNPNPDEDLTAAEDAKLVEKATATESKGEPIEEFGSTVTLSRALFSKFVFAFEAVSALLLVAIVGAVALARSKGGTHHVG